MRVPVGIWTGCFGQSFLSDEALSGLVNYTVFVTSSFCGLHPWMKKLIFNPIALRKTKLHTFLAFLSAVGLKGRQN